MPQSQADRLRRVASRQNTLVKALHLAFKKAELTPGGGCAIEGVRLMEEAIRSGLTFQAVFFSDAALPQAERLLPQIGERVETLVLPQPVFASVVSTETPQGVAALVQVKQHTLEEVLRKPDAFLLVAAGVQDPGNLGTILRSAEAFGATAVVVTEGTVSMFNSKVVRASAGSIFRLPVVAAAKADLLTRLHAAGVRLIATSSHKGKPLHQAHLTGKLAVFVGNEGAGLPKELLAAMDELVVIPHAATVESLNAAVASSVVLYEASRQRSISGEHKSSSHEPVSTHPGGR